MDKEQLDAITARGGTVLVSAAAGSGKTAVLVERVIQRILDPIAPVDADRLLIVTFSKAAAQEMKQRISLKLSQLIEENPRTPLWPGRQSLLARAQISTIHFLLPGASAAEFPDPGPAAGLPGGG